MKRLFFYFIFIIVVFFNLVGCDFIYGLLQKAGAEEKAILGEIIPFTDNEKVLQTQQFLNIYGFNPGKLDGRMGPKTRDALEEFQKQNGLKPTRFVDRKTWAKLNIIKEIGLAVNGDINIETVQMILAEAGFDPGKIDGKLGPKTMNALQEFQSANGLKADGKIGPMTIEKLIEFLPAR